MIFLINLKTVFVIHNDIQGQCLAFVSNYSLGIIRISENTPNQGNCFNTQFGY